MAKPLKSRGRVRVRVGRVSVRAVYKRTLIAKKAARTFDKIRSGGNQSGRSREQKIVRVHVRTLFERFLYK